MLLSACSTTKELIVLLPEEGGKVGAVAIEEKQRTIVLDTPLDAAKINTQSRVQKDKVTKEEADKLLEKVRPTIPPSSLCFRLYFLENSTEITPESRSDLVDLLAAVAERPVVEVEITGHTDHMGPAAINDRLSLDRAKAVQGMLEKSGLKADFIRTVGRGAREPLIPPQPGQKEEPRNRRVEVIVR
jgi:outer membrane protein OmpA-like peptidoglycan-associated protein